MTAPKILLYLHGVRSHIGGSEDARSLWRELLFSKLREIGYESLENLRVIAPQYTHLIVDSDEKIPVPKIRIDELKRSADDSRLRQYELRLSTLEAKMGHSFLGPGKFYQDKLVEGATNVGPLKQAKMYIENDGVRGAVLTQILSALPESGHIVMVGHSLGSVVAADLIRRLPEDLRVDGIVTIGSPIGSAYFGKSKILEKLKNPPANLEWWINFWGTGDPVSASRGVSARIPWVLDFAINTGADPVGAHSSARYISHPEVAHSIGNALLGSASKEILLSETGVEVPLDSQEWFDVAALRFIYLIENALQNSSNSQDRKTHARFASVRRIIQSKIIGGLIEKRANGRKPIPAELIRMDVDLSQGFDMTTPVPSFPIQIEPQLAVEMLPRLFAGNPISPYEISIREDICKQAAKELTTEMGLGSLFGEQVLAVLEKAETALRGKNGSKVWKIGAASLGVVAVAAATGGLALAAAPGVYGGAAIVSALAAFGPGGMMGGLLSSGALLSAGTGTLALSLSNAGNSVEATEQMLILPLAEAGLRKKYQLDDNPRIWFEIVDAEIQIQRQFEHLAAFCDQKSSVLDGFELKLKAIREAINFLEDLGLAPNSDNPAPSAHKRIS